MLTGLPKSRKKKQVSYVYLLNADMVYSPNKISTTILNVIVSGNPTNVDNVSIPLLYYIINIQ